MTKLAKIMLIALTLGAFGIYLTSCSQSEILETTTENTVEQSPQEFKLSEHGWLHFENEAALDAARNEVVQYMRNGNLDEFEEKYGYKSLHTAYWETMENLTDEQKITMASQRRVSNEYKDIFTFIGEGEDMEAVRTIESDILATLINHRGVYQIGDEIHKYNYDVVKIIKDGDVDKLTTLEDINSSNPSLNVVVESHNHNRILTTNSDGGLTMREDCNGDKTHKVSSAKKKARRIQGRITLDPVGNTVFHHVTISARKQRQFIAWYDNNWSGWVESRATDFRAWQSFTAPGSTDIFFYSGESKKRTNNEGFLATVFYQENIGAVGSPGVWLNFDLEFEGHWNGNRHFNTSYEDSQHLIECY